jgi:cytoskeletal protein CcmA (bactofilin family)
VTIIAKGTEVSGAITIDGNIRIDGVVRGDITATDGVEVGKTGLVVGTTIQSKTAIIHGQVEGHLIAPQHITLGGKAKLLGEIKTGNLVIEEGAIFHGNSTMMNEEKPKGKEK